MIKIKILCVGNLKENYLLAMQNEYLKRLTNYAKIEIKEEKEEKSNELNDSIILQILNKEGERLLKKINDNDYVILLDLHGKEMDSIKFAKLMGVPYGFVKPDLNMLIYFISKEGKNEKGEYEISGGTIRLTRDSFVGVKPFVCKMSDYDFIRKGELFNVSSDESERWRRHVYLHLDEAKQKEYKEGFTNSLFNTNEK